MRKEREGSEVGATAVEVTIMLPIFLCAVFAIIWFGQMYNARAALVAAVSTGARLAYTRGDSTLAGVPATSIINQINAWRALGCPAGGGMAPTLQALLVKPNPTATANLGLGWYTSEFTRLFGAGYCLNLPPQYVMSIIYAHQSMLSQVSDVGFPCDGSNCIKCIPLHAGTKDICAPGQARTLQPGNCPTNATPVPPATIGAPLPGFGTAGYPNNYNGVFCQFQASSAVIDPLIGLLRVVSNGNLNPAIMQESGFFSHKPARGPI